MFNAKQIALPLTLMLVLLLSACGKPASPDSAPSSPSAAPSASASATASASASPKADTAATTKLYKDIQNREVQIPVHPQKIVYIGSNPGDLLAIGVKPIGASLSVIAGQVAYPNLLENIQDVGYPYSLEKVLALEPDLIIFDDWDEKGLPPLEKIAPTVVTGLDGTDPTEKRVKRVADMLGRTDAAEAWFNKYADKVAATKQKLNLQGDETAVSLLLMSKNMFIMGNQGLNATLFGQLGLKPSAGVQKLIDKDERFIDVSSEVLPDYMGSDIFILNDNSEETASTQNALMGSSLWKTVPAVQKGHVYMLNSKYNFDDPITLDLLLDEIVNVMSKATAK